MACNTASAFSLTHLRERFELPIIGLVPAVKPAVTATKSGVVGVLATPGTLRGTLLADVIRQWAEPAGVRVMQAVSTELVPLVEAGKADSPEARVVLRDVLEPLAEAGADQLVLGCTHYPFLAGSIPPSSATRSPWWTAAQRWPGTPATCCLAAACCVAATEWAKSLTSRPVTLPICAPCS
ncbi:aspartate/glutamate racemase family protein [Deinococcus sp. PESE-38]